MRRRGGLKVNFLRLISFILQFFVSIINYNNFLVSFLFSYSHPLLTKKFFAKVIMKNILKEA